MGLFSKLKAATGSVDGELLAHGVLGRGTIISVDLTGMAVTSGVDEYRVCQVTLQVNLDNTPAYTATCRQRIPIYVLGQLQPGNTVVAVRVDPNDQSRVAIDFNTEPPTVTMARGSGQSSAAEVLATGIPARGVIVATQPLGMRNPDGLDMYAFLLTVMPQGGVPYQTQVGNPVPPTALPFLYPGSQVQVKIEQSNPQAVVIDWAATAAAQQVPQ